VIHLFLPFCFESLPIVAAHLQAHYFARFVLLRLQRNP
jgi:hypothetical protein